MLRPQARGNGLFSGTVTTTNTRHFLEAIQCMIYLTEHTALAGVPIKTLKEMRERVLTLQDRMKMPLRDLIPGANPQLIEIVMTVDRNLNDKCDQYRKIILPLSQAEQPGLAAELSDLLNKKPEAKAAPASAVKPRPSDFLAPARQEPKFQPRGDFKEQPRQVHVRSPYVNPPDFKERPKVSPATPRLPEKKRAEEVFFPGSRDATNQTLSFIETLECMAHLESNPVPEIKVDRMQNLRKIILAFRSHLPEGTDLRSLIMTAKPSPEIWKRVCDADREMDLIFEGYRQLVLHKTSKPSKTQAPGGPVEAALDVPVNDSQPGAATLKR